jgi:hypothetical protein
MIKKAAFWAAILIMASSVSYGTGRYQEALVVLVDDVKIIADGQQVVLKNTDGSGILPINYNGRIYLPVRSVADITGAEINWVSTERAIYLDTTIGDAGEEEAGYASLTAVAYMTGKALQEKDYSSLSQLTHPSKGVRFSINGKVEPEIDVVLSKADFQNAGLGIKDYQWGVEDGSAAPLVMTVNTFFDRFHHDFENPMRTGWNERITKYGVQETPEKGISLIEGGETVYADGEFAEYYFAGSSGEEFDWNSYIFIYEKYGGSYYLTGVLHNYWLI